MSTETPIRRTGAEASLLSRFLGPAKASQEPTAPGHVRGTHSLIQQACSTFSVTADELRSRSRSSVLVQARVWVAHHAITYRATSIAAVARLFNRDESTLRHGMQKYFGAD
jgi:chromosomal replication initiation ATPase DnaA